MSHAGAAAAPAPPTLLRAGSGKAYRPAGSWEDASQLIVSEAGRQFDQAVVDAFLKREQAMRSPQFEFATRAELN